MACREQDSRASAAVELLAESGMAGLPYNDVDTTMIYTHVLKRCGKAVNSPLDATPGAGEDDDEDEGSGGVRERRAAYCRGSGSIPTARRSALTQ